MAKGNQNKRNNKKQSIPVKSNQFKQNKSIINKNLKTVDVDVKSKKPFINNQSPKTFIKNGRVNIAAFSPKEASKKNSVVVAKGNNSEKKTVAPIKKIDAKVVKEEVSEDEEDSDVDDIDLDASEDDEDESAEGLQEDSDGGLDVDDLEDDDSDMGSIDQNSDMESIEMNSDDSDIEEVDSDGEIAYAEESDEESDEEEEVVKTVPVKEIKKEGKKVEATKEVKKVEAAKEVKKVEAAKEVKKAEAAEEVKKAEAAKEVKKVEAAKAVKKVEAAKEVKKAEAAKEVKKVEAAKEVKNVEAVKEVKKIEAVKEVKKIEAVKEVKKIEAVKEVKKIEAVKEVKKIEAVKEVKKIEAVKEIKKVENKKNQKKNIKVEELKFIDPTTESGKLLIEMNKRKDSMTSSTVFVKNLAGDVTVEIIKDLLPNVVTVNLPSKIRNGKKKVRGYCFLRFVNNADANDASLKINGTTLKGKKLVTSPFICKKICNDIDHVDFNTIFLTSDKTENIIEDLKTKFNKGVTIKVVNLITYELTFDNKSDAMALFIENTVLLSGNKLSANFRYNIGEVFDNTQIPTPTEKIVKAGMKRSKPESNDDTGVKKVKVEVNNLIKTSEKGKKVEGKTPESKEAVCKTLEKKVKTEVKTPENKVNIKKKNKKTPQGNNKN